MDFQARLKAAILHLLVTGVVAILVAALVFGIWFPGAFSEMLGGRRLFWLVLGCDLALGPLISLVIYNTQKPRRELIRDYCIVGLLQMGALIYGVSIVVESRPVYMVFVVDRLEVVTAIELEDEELAQARDKRYQSRGWSGPRLISVERPDNPEERSQILFSALDGKDIHLMPKYYRPYSAAIDQVRERVLPVELLISRNPDSEAMIDAAIKKSGGEAEQVRWLPVHSRFGFWVALIDFESAMPLLYLPVNPY